MSNIIKFSGSTKADIPLSPTQTLEFSIYDRNQDWNKVPGLYIFTHRVTSGAWRPLYVGQTDDFVARLPSHERLNEAVQLGATHIHARVVHQAADRAQWERMLIQHLQPPMNTQFR